MQAVKLDLLVTSSAVAAMLAYGQKLNRTLGAATFWAQW